MMSITRISAVVVRHLRLQFRDIMRFSDAVYWPIIDLLLWGLNSIWIASYGTPIHVMKTVVICAFLWQIAYRANLEISTNLLEEMWERNMLNLFCTPLTFLEWILGLLVVSLVRVALVFCVCVLTTQLLFGINIFSLGVGPLLYCIVSLLVSGWALGCFNSAIVVWLGRRAQNIPWIFVWMFSPLCGAFSDISVLPAWLSKIAVWLPMTSVFVTVRAFLETGEFNYGVMQSGLVIGFFYLVLGYFLFLFLFERSKQRGLSMLE